MDYNPRNSWKGQLGIEDALPVGVKPRFAKFSTPEYGIRAMYQLLKTYARKYNADTVQEIVTRYAPSHENKTDKYIEHVCEWAGLRPDEVIRLDDPDVAVPLLRAMIRQENGYCPYTDETIRKAMTL